MRAIAGDLLPVPREVTLLARTPQERRLLKDSTAHPMFRFKQASIDAPRLATRRWLGRAGRSVSRGYFGGVEEVPAPADGMPARSGRILSRSGTSRASCHA